jgi:hypothetical protein
MPKKIMSGGEFVPRMSGETFRGKPAFRRAIAKHGEEFASCLGEYGMHDAPMRSLLLFGVAAVVGFASGFSIFRPESASNPVAPTNEPTAANSSLSHDARVAAPSFGTVTPPDGALLAAMEREPDEIKQGAALYVAVSRLDATAIRALFELPQNDAFKKHLSSLPEQLREALWRGLIERWLEVDEAAALAWLPHAQDSMADAKKELPWIFRAFASASPDAAEAFVRSVADMSQRKEFARQLIDTLAAKNPGRARDWFAHFPEPELQEAIQRGYRRGLSRNDPRAALALAQTLPDSPERKELQDWIKADAAERGPALALEIDRALDGKRSLQRLQSLTESDPISAARVIGEMLANPETEETANDRSDLAYAAAAALARADPAKACAWAATLPEELRAVAFLPIAGIWSDYQPKEALLWFHEQYRADLEHFPVRAEIYKDSQTQALSQWLGADPTAALAWLDTLPDRDLRSRLQAGVLPTLARNGNFDEIERRWSGVPAEMFKSVARDMAGSLALVEPERTVAWARQVAEQRQDGEPFEIAIEQWFLKEPQTVAPWVEALPAGLLRDAGAAACARVAIALDAPAAVEWVAQIADAKARRAAAEAIVTTWRRRDPKAADAWLAAQRGAQP